MAGITWSNEELDFLRKNFEDKSCEEIGASLGRTTRSVQHKFGELKLTRKQPEVGETISGSRFTILEKYIKPHYNQNKTYVKVQCNCTRKTVKDLPLSVILDGNTKSCGCIKSEIKSKECAERNYIHGQSINPENELYKKWIRMKYNSGIEVCPEWQEYLDFEKWSLENGYEEGFHIYRLDEIEGIYEPSNCLWHPMGIAEERLYKTWVDMITRCYNPNFKQYHNYGGRGISICREWNKRYFIFKEWAMKNGYTDDLTIERIDVNGNYEPDNCTWIPLSEQGKNKTNTKQNKPA